MAIKNQDYIKNLIRELISLPSETEWVEFKHNNDDPQMIGEYISALGNSATLLGRPKAYMLWGIDDAGTYEITNLGALLISKDLSSFEELSHKSVRVIWYKDNNRLDTIREKVFSGGYAIAYNEIV